MDNEFEGRTITVNLTTTYYIKEKTVVMGLIRDGFPIEEINDEVLKQEAESIARVWLDDNMTDENFDASDDYFACKVEIIKNE